MTTTTFNIFLLDINSEKSVIGLHFFFLISKFLEYQISVVILLIKCLKFKFLYSKIMHKKKVYESYSK